MSTTKRCKSPTLPRPDLQVFEVIAPDEVDAGGTASAEFVIINQGSVGTTVPNWTDSVYLSLDDKFTPDDIRVDTLSNEAALEPTEQYRSITSTFQVPIRFRGTVYLIVVADSGNAVDEFPRDNNNDVLHELFVNPFPFADLVASEVRAPAEAIEGATFDVDYTVTNLGSGPTNRESWTEQIWLTKDRNRPHPGQGDTLLATIPYTDGVLRRDAGYDRENITITLPSSVPTGNYYITPWVDPFAVVDEDTLAINVNPDDPNEIDNNNYKARLIKIFGLTTPPADIAVTDIEAQAVGKATEEFTVSWEVSNVSDGHASSWVDQVFLSKTPDRRDPGHESLLLGSFSNVQSLKPGESYGNTQTFTLPPTAEGMYVHVESTLADEDRSNNQITGDTIVTRTNPDLIITDLTTEGVGVSGEQVLVRYTVENVSAELIWSDTKYWTDQIWFSKDQVFTVGRGNDFLEPGLRSLRLGTVTQSGAAPLLPGESYTNEVVITVPQGIGGNYHVHAFVNSINDDPSRDPGDWPFPASTAATRFIKKAYEDTRNNHATVPLAVVYREPDLRITELDLPTSLTAGQTIEATYTVTNIGNRATRSEEWKDRFFISFDPSLDNQDYRLNEITVDKAEPAEFERLGTLKAGESYEGTVRFTLPFQIEGDFHIIGYVDAGIGNGSVNRSNRFVSNIAPDLPGVTGSGVGDVREFLDEGNNENAVPVQVLPLVPPDLRVTSVTGPATSVRGQDLTVSFTVENLGGDTLPLQTRWNDLVYLSRDEFLDTRADRFLGSIRREGALVAGETYTVEHTFRTPTDLPSDPANPLQEVTYQIFVVTDPARNSVSGDVFEGSNERNNDRVSDKPVTVQFPPPSDLVITDITIPREARSGEPVELTWTVTNVSDQTINGSWSDAAYLSTDASWDIQDRPVGRVGFSGTLGSGETYTRSLTVNLPPATPGQYRGIVRTDIFNQVFELEKDLNNTTASPNAMTVKVDELFLGVEETLLLKPGQEKLYQVSVPLNQTLRIRLSSDNVESTNEVFVRYDQAPTSALFDATYEGFLTSDPLVFVPSTLPGIYYVLIRGFSGDDAGANVEILAELLPLVITNIHTDTGGDSKYVTTTIEGAQFRAGAIVKLVRPGIEEIEPLQWKVIDSTKIIAQFDFTGAEHGLYDLKVINPDGAEAILPYRFLN